MVTSLIVEEELAKVMSKHKNIKQAHTFIPQSSHNPPSGLSRGVKEYKPPEVPKKPQSRAFEYKQPGSAPSPGFSVDQREESKAKPESTVGSWLSKSKNEPKSHKMENIAEDNWYSNPL